MITDKEKSSITTSFLTISQDKNIENKTKRILTHVLKSWDVNTSSAHPSAPALTTSEVVALKVYFIELKYHYLYLLIYSQSDSLYVEIFP